MSVTLESQYIPHPQPKKLASYFLTYLESKNLLAYYKDNCVFIQNLLNQMESDYYTEHVSKVTAVSFSPAGKYIASGDESGAIRVWYPTHEQKLLVNEVRIGSNPIEDMSWTDDQQRLAYASNGQTYGAVVSPDAGNQFGSFIGHSGHCNTCALKPNRPFKAVTGADDQTAVFYTGPPFVPKKFIRDHEKYVTCVRYARDGSVFVTVSFDGTMKVYDGVTADLVNTFTLGGLLSCCSFSPDSKHILVSSLGGHVYVVTVADGTVEEDYFIGSQPHQQQVSVIWAKDKKISLSVNGDFNFLNDGKIEIHRGHSSAINAVCRIPGGFATGDSSGKILFWRFNEVPYAVAEESGSAPFISSMALMDDNEHIVVARGTDSIQILNISDASVANSFTTKQTVKQVVTKGDKIYGISSEGLIIITGTDKKVVELPYQINAVSINNDGSKIAVADNAKKVHLLDGNGAELKTYAGFNGEVITLQFSPSGDKLACSTTYKDIVVYKMGEDEPIIDGWRFHTLKITKLIWIDDTNLVSISLDRSIRIWNVNRRRKSVAFESAHIQAINDGFMVDSSTLLTVGADGMIRTWKIEPMQ